VPLWRWLERRNTSQLRFLYQVVLAKLAAHGIVANQLLPGGQPTTVRVNQLRNLTLSTCLDQVLRTQSFNPPSTPKFTR